MTNPFAGAALEAAITALAAAVFPMLPETDLAALAADIVEHGLRRMWRRP